MRNLAELNINEGGEPVTRSAPTASDLEQFRKEFGFPLPPQLLHLLAFANGGCPEISSIDGPSGQYAIDTIYHLTNDDRGTESIWYAMKHWRPILGAKAVPFATDGGGDQFFLDLSQDPAPVKICLHEEDCEIVELAGSFAEFLDRLHIDPDMI
jgi:cell wall assembly regulator SMI1